MMSQYSNSVVDDRLQGPVDVSAEPRLENTYALFSDLCLEIHAHQRSLEHKLSFVDQQIKAADKRREAEQAAKAQLKRGVLSLIAQLPVGLVCLDYQGRVAEVNQAAHGLFEVDIKGRLWREVIQTEFSPKADDGFEVSLKNGRIVKINTQSLGQELADSLGVGQLLILDDLTETREFQATQSRDQRLSELGKMSATLAHQIRTPLSTAILYANHLAKYDMSDAKRRKSTAKLLSQLTQIEKQIRDMLFYIRGDAPAQDRVQLTALLEQSVQSVVSDLEQRGVRLITKFNVGQAVLKCHRATLVGALGNLICNAIDVSHAHAWVKFESEIIDRQWVTRIIDAGPGISTDDQKKLFMPFFSTKKNGNGLGISTAKMIIESHGGQLQVESELGQGTCVTVQLPI